jgi:general secretion pathway protein H
MPVMGTRARGFTLIEVLVVVMIIVVIVGLVGVRLARGPEDIVREESERLALVLSAAREEAILQGRVYAFGAARESYRFMRLEKDGRLKPTSADELLRPKRLPQGIAIELLKIEGVGEETLDGLVFLPSGELPAFRVVLAGGGVRWSVVGETDGTIRAQAGS